MAEMKGDFAGGFDSVGHQIEKVTEQLRQTQSQAKKMGWQVDQIQELLA